jgi:hypothetical protein
LGAPTQYICLPATPDPQQNPVHADPDYLRSKAESLIRALSDADGLPGQPTPSSPELIVDSYAHVLALDVDGLRLEREIARLAESGDPRVARELRELSGQLRDLTRTSEKLRSLLGAARSRNEPRG